MLPPIGNKTVTNENKLLDTKKAAGSEIVRLLLVIS